MDSHLDFSIVTPSLNMFQYLPQCCASVADQTGISLEHIVMDGGSTDGTVEWVCRNDMVRSVSEKDDGMYDAINKGWAISRGKYLAYLNCDEQYLPDTLSTVKACFELYPDVDAVFGDTLILNPNGDLIAYRKCHQLRWFYIMSSYLYVFSCSMFLRRKIVEDGFQFDTNLKAVGDADFVTRLLKRRYRFFYLKQYLATFAKTDENKTIARASLDERARFEGSAPHWVKVLRVHLNMARLLERVLSGVYYQSFPLSYKVYVPNELETRMLFVANRASFRLKWSIPRAE